MVWDVTGVRLSSVDSGAVRDFISVSASRQVAVILLPPRFCVSHTHYRTFARLFQGQEES
jgi:hypothetical protein